MKKSPSKAKGKAMKGMKGPEPKMPSPGRFMKGEASAAEKMMGGNKPMMGKGKERM